MLELLEQWYSIPSSHAPNSNIHLTKNNPKHQALTQAKTDKHAANRYWRQRCWAMFSVVFLAYRIIHVSIYSDDGCRSPSHVTSQMWRSFVSNTSASPRRSSQRLRRMEACFCMVGKCWNQLFLPWYFSHFAYQNPNGHGWMVTSWCHCMKQSCTKYVLEEATVLMASGGTSMVLVCLFIVWLHHILPRFEKLR